MTFINLTDLSRSLASKTSSVFNSPIQFERRVNYRTLKPYLSEVQKTQEFDQVPRKEMVFIGRSNVGKSSLLNATLNNYVAHTSNTPGKTRELYFYRLEKLNLYLVDAPGYGYATGDRKELVQWGQMMRQYLQFSPFLEQVFILIDCEHGLKEVDNMVFELVSGLKKPFCLVGTKMDKVKKDKIDDVGKVGMKISEKYFGCNKFMNVTSARNGEGILEFRQRIVSMV